MTGATNTVGLATATALAGAGAQVTVRNTELGAAASDRDGVTPLSPGSISPTCPRSGLPGRLDDLGVTEIDILINNASALTGSGLDIKMVSRPPSQPTYSGPFA